ncbi:MAG: heme-binding beta-barrel domain-containing protein [Candidatus Pelagadaptatus aseana]|uniref:heme-binding beta-barrel domain-containing protein n=1 Tax=Candidatus Pelagadaptatus aseana TaxID=3120508 RepID=UPI0039B2C3B0
MNDEVDYGPLAGLIGTWKGDRGVDIAPEPDGTERNPFYEVITFEAAGDVDNAEEQELAVVRYHQQVFRSSNDKQFHDQVGYWTWDAATGSISNSFVIPRRVAVVAGGKVVSQEDGVITIQVDAADGDPDWGVSQSPFMRDKARTVAFTQTLVIERDALTYRETTALDIYGRDFDHKDSSRLIRVD